MCNDIDLNESFERNRSQSERKRGKERNVREKAEECKGENVAKGLTRSPLRRNIGFDNVCTFERDAKFRS